MAARSPEERIDRLEQVMQIIAEDHLAVKDDHRSLKEGHLSLQADQQALQKLVAELATETRRGFDQVAAQFRETDARLDKLAREGAERSRSLDERMDRLARESTERSKALDERVDRLVSPIGEMMRRQDATKPS